MSLASEVLLAYFGVRRSLARRGLETTLAGARDVPSSFGERSEPGAADGRYVGYRLGQIVERVLRFLPDARCLTRSIVLIRLLARRGIVAKLVIGVSPAPAFRAHAWVEVDGIALLPAYEQEYSRLVEL